MIRHAPIVLLLGGVAFGTGYVLNYFWPKPQSTATAQDVKLPEPRPIPVPPPARPAIDLDPPAARCWN